MVLRVIIFLAINFAALGVGGFLSGKGVPSDWYQNLNKAPWTPPGWVFGMAWTLIMICFSFYMAYAYKELNNKQLLIGLFIFQLILNIGWNPSFFYFHNAALGLKIIVSLTILICFLFFKFWSQLSIKSLLLLPYIIWLFIATSLNLFIFLKN